MRGVVGLIAGVEAAQLETTARSALRTHGMLDLGMNQSLNQVIVVFM